MGNPTPVFVARIDGSRVSVLNQLAFTRYLRKLDGKEVELVVRRRKSKRSLQANAYWWAVPVEIMADYMGEERTATHYALLGECFGYHRNEQLKRQVPNKGSSSALTVEEFSALIEWCPPWALDKFGVHIPLPNECDYEVEPC